LLRNLLICGLVAGALAGLVATGFAQLAGESAVEQAISFEAAAAKAAGEPAEVPIVSRAVQRSAGLLTAAVVYGLALGGLFALAFAVVYGRVGRASPARTALWLAAAAFVVVYLVPFVKYPANPPSIGDHETITRRSVLYLVMIAISVIAAVAAVRIQGRLRRRGASGWTPVAAGIASYLAVVIGAALALPGVHEVPATFPAETLWRFREASVGMQLVLWATIGVVFATGADRVMRRAMGRVPQATPLAVED
jgi:uncharacterized membrane protein YidH (DUF202 family)